MRQVILFDIDGTLLTSRGGGKVAMERAAFELFGLEDALAGVKMHGNTDPLIFAEILRRAGVRDDDPDALDRLLSKYLEVAPKYMEASGVDPLPGVPEAMARLKEAGFLLTIVTGNVRETAELKLRLAGIVQFFDLDVGGYGSDAGDRRHFLAAALRRLGERGPFGAVLVGDTPFDVTAAHANGVPCLGVATGPHPVRELLEWEAEAVMPSMGSITPELVRALMSLSKDEDHSLWERLHG